MIKPETLYRWAKNKLGNSKCLRIKYCNRKQKFYGEYNWENREIILNLRFIKSNWILYKTVAHEWTHAQQKMDNYETLLKEFGYQKHPLEVSARKVENNLWSNIIH